MATRLEKQDSETPLYVRWGPDRSLYAIELRLDLISEILSALLDAAETSSAEIGGVLLGAITEGATPTVRIDDLKLVPRAPDEGIVYMPNQAQLDHAAKIRQAAKARGQTAVGYFRSHSRPGPMRPAPADHGLFSDGPKTPQVVMLARAKEPRTAAFFVATDGEFPAEPSVREFALDETEFRALPEVRAEVPRPAVPPRIQPEKSNEGSLPQERRRLGYWGIAAAFILAFAASWVVTRTNAFARWLRPPSNQIGLAILPDGSNLNVHWDFGSRGISDANGANIVITDGNTRREIKLGPDELKLGRIEYQRISNEVAVTMDLQDATVTLPPQTVSWTAP